MLAAVLDAIDLVELVRLLVASAGVDEHRTDLVLDQEAAHAELDAVPRVRRDAALPQRLGDDAKHRAAVELLPAGLNRVHRPASEPPGLHAGPKRGRRKGAR